MTVLPACLGLARGIRQINEDFGMRQASGGNIHGGGTFAAWLVVVGLDTGWPPDHQSRAQEPENNADLLLIVPRLF